MRFIVQADKSVALPRSPMRSRVAILPRPPICPLGKGCDALRDRFAAEDQAAPDIAASRCIDATVVSVIR